MTANTNYFASMDLNNTFSSGNSINSEIFCIICAECKTDTHNAIICEKNHAICVDCCQDYINLIFAEPYYNIPPKCPECKKPINIGSIEAQLCSDKLFKFRQLLSKNDSGNDKLYCASDIKVEKDVFENKTDREIYCDIIKAIEAGSKVFCPKCKLGGRKDTSCTHITCGNCDTTFCYVCGLSELKCNTGLFRMDICYHNDDWEINKLRCPLYLNEIWRVDSKWEGIHNEKQALDFFHKLRILKILKILVKKEGLEKISSFEEKYGVLKKEGFTISEIIKSDDEIIQRKNGTYINRSSTCTVV